MSPSSKPTFLKVLLIVTVLVNASQPIFINTTSINPNCYYKAVSAGEFLSGSFVVSGYNEENVFVGVRLKFTSTF